MKHLQTCFDRRPGRFQVGAFTARPRSAAVLLELIIALPILIIIVVGIVQFGLFFQNLQQLALASRVGAHAAAETAALPAEGEVAGDPVPMAIVTAITQQLSSSGIDPCAIILEHNVNSGTTLEQTLRTDTAPNCPDCDEPGSAIPGHSVRVTVCVRMDELMPNCLTMFGFDVANYVSQSSTTFCYEATAI